MEKQEKTLKSLTAARRCAKAALFLYALKSTNSDNEKIWRKEIQDLKIQLLQERFINKKIKLCSFIELLVQLLFFLLLSTFFLFFLLTPR